MGFIKNYLESHRKLDEKKDYLSLRCDINTGEHYFVKHDGNGGQIIVSEDRLNSNAKKKINTCNMQWKCSSEYRNQKIKEKKILDNVQFYKSVGIDLGTVSSLHLNPNRALPNDIKSKLESLVNEDNVSIAIHRVTGYMDNEKLNNIFYNGLDIAGHLGGVVNTKKEITNTVSFYADNSEILTQVMYADEFKQRTGVGSILFKFPFNDLRNNHDILLNINGNLKINPKYIYAYLPISEGKVQNMIENPNYYNYRPINVQTQNQQYFEVNNSLVMSNQQYSEVDNSLVTDNQTEIESTKHM